MAVIHIAVTIKAIFP